MRNILFKAKRKDNGEWVEGYYYKRIQERNVVDAIETYNGNIHSIKYYEINPKTLCQYTELKDNYGNKIWENDIINYGFRNEKGIVRFGTHKNVSSNNHGFYVEWANKWCSYRQDLGYFADVIEASVVGNVFDNKELINRKGEKNE